MSIAKSAAKYLGFIIILFLVGAAPFLLVSATSLQIDKVTISHPGVNIQKAIQLPYSVAAPRGDGTESIYTLEIFRSRISNSEVHITPDDCVDALSINGQALDLSPYQNSLCDYKKGFVVNLDKQLVYGANTIIMSIRNLSGEYGLRIASGNNLIITTFFSAVACSLLLAWWLVKNRRACGILIIGLLTQSYALYVTNINLNPLDLHAHLNTIYEYARGHFPDPNQGNESHQPPMYYAFGGLIHALTEATGKYTNYTVLNYTFIFFALMMIYVVRLCLLALPEPSPLRTWALVCLMILPSNYFHCCRISNDIPLYATMMMAFYHMISWYKFDRARDFLITIFVVALAFLIKSSALITGLCFFVTFVIKCRFSPRTALQYLWRFPFRKTLMLACLLLLLCASFNMMRIAYMNYQHKTGLSLLLGGVRGWAPGSNARLNIAPRNYLTLDYWRYINEPFWKYWDARSDREFFWNLYLKSYAFSMTKWKAYNAASVANFLLLVCYLWLLSSAVKRYVTEGHTPDVGAFTAIFKLIIAGCMIAMQIYYPEPGYADTRHTYPTVPMFFILYFFLAAQCKNASHRIGCCLLITPLMLTYSYILLFEFWLHNVKWETFF